MIRRWLCILVVMIGLVAVASGAAADCAWVLWISSLNPPPGIAAWQAWRPVEAFVAQAQCKKQADLRNRKALQATDRYKFEFVCLPDTVDPHAKKAK